MFKRLVLLTAILSILMSFSTSCDRQISDGNVVSAPGSSSTVRSETEIICSC